MLKFLFVLPLSFKEIEGKIRELIYREFSYIQDEYLFMIPTKARWRSLQTTSRHMTASFLPGLISTII